MTPSIIDIRAKPMAFLVFTSKLGPQTLPILICLNELKRIDLEIPLYIMLQLPAT
jgi:hypothetical protein